MKRKVKLWYHRESLFIVWAECTDDDGERWIFIIGKKRWWKEGDDRSVMRQALDVLIINSYAGSLTIAATQLGLKIRGSYEDAGFGLKVQRANFPYLKYVEALPWPKDDLANTVVIAHPPCAAFSMQNMSRRQHMGLATEAFACHKRVMKYALGQGCRALAVESVVGALEGARRVHDAYARRYGYQVYRLLQNAVTFGVPQWRERFWVIFMKEPAWPIAYESRYNPLSAVLGVGQGTPLKSDREAEVALRRVEEIGMSRQYFIDQYLSGEVTGNLLSILETKAGLARKGHLVARKKYNLDRIYFSKIPYVLNPERWAPVVLSDRSWWTMGRPIYEEDYKRIMGFPADYLFPESTRNDLRKYLSKGVCPPVARWILENLCFQVRTADLMAVPGKVLDLRVTKKAAEVALRQRRLFR